MSRFEVRWTQAGHALWGEVSDARLRAKLLTLAATLGDEPAQKGRPLRDELAGYFSLHWSRWRIIYSLDKEAGCVWIFAVGHRAEGKPSDVYRTASKLLRLGLLTPPRRKTPKSQLQRSRSPHRSPAKNKTTDH